MSCGCLQLLVEALRSGKNLPLLNAPFTATQAQYSQLMDRNLVSSYIVLTADAVLLSFLKSVLLTVWV